ncbi:unnamed protein product [Caenorhabditis nigoni]
MITKKVLNDDEKMIDGLFLEEQYHMGYREMVIFRLSTPTSSIERLKGVRPTAPIVLTAAWGATKHRRDTFSLSETTKIVK